MELGAWLAPAEVPVEAPVALRIAVRAGRLDVEVGRKRVLGLSPAGLDISGRWGFGGPAGARTAWSEVRVR